MAPPRPRRGCSAETGRGLLPSRPPARRRRVVQHRRHGASSQAQGKEAAHAYAQHPISLLLDGKFGEVTFTKTDVADLAGAALTSSITPLLSGKLDVPRHDCVSRPCVLRKCVRVALLTRLFPSDVLAPYPDSVVKDLSVWRKLWRRRSAPLGSRASGPAARRQEPWTKVKEEMQFVEVLVSEQRSRRVEYTASARATDHYPAGRR